ncbi:TRAP transporter large permease [Oceanobacillus alkalisoli]|uniref:TRAP transporter large permease n=1 Tax=Oceanobacillus alkalisoli TaxID=2925113 RepID=UPI001F11EA01|nr:TRAP transporter large permease [Oceanobacillus alkalisoli]MCF3944146.1 TRAP transporter large permease [Oceanobacillus alkalisoli]
MDGTLAFLIVIVLFAVLLALGMHIGTVLIVSGIVGAILIDGFASLPGVVQDSSFYSVATYSLTTIPLFILMAQFIVRSNIIGLLYNFVFQISRQNGGMLGVFTMMLGGFLGALSGSPTAISAALAQISLPQLRMHGYNKYFATATIAMAGSLSTIIPPSIILIVYGTATMTSIGELFIAMVVPVILILVTVSIAVFVMYRITYVKDDTTVGMMEVAPAEEELGMEPNKKNYIISIGSLLIIIGTIFIGIFLGIFTPTEAGAIGAFLSLIMAALLKRVDVQFLKDSLIGTINISAMVMFIILGASIFGKFVTISLIPINVINWISPLMDTPILLMAILLVIYFFLFMIIEGTAVILMTVSIALPIVTEAGFDPIVFGVLLTIVCAAGLLTPPVGLSVFSAAGVARIPSQKVFFYGTIYAFIIVLVTVPILLLFPELVTWLPDRM